MIRSRGSCYNLWQVHSSGGLGWQKSYSVASHYQCGSSGDLAQSSVAGAAVACGHLSSAWSVSGPVTSSRMPDPEVGPIVS